MPLNIEIATIPHTGTGFVQTLLKDIAPPTCHLTHDGIMESLRFKGTLIIPLRKPKHVAWTWIKRGTASEQFHWDPMWLSLRNFDKAFFFFIEEDQKDIQLKELSEIVGYELTTDWSAIDSQGEPGECEFDGGLAAQVYENLRYK